MGLNVMVMTLDRQEHPDWDDGKYSGDRFLFEAADMVPREDHMVDFVFGGSCDWYWRPTDFEAFRKLDWPHDNAGRWQLLADILERDRDYWIFLSV